MGDEHIRVLVIEDNVGDVRLIREMLSEVAGVDFELVCVGRLSEGLECLDQRNFDVILLDLLLPDSRGLDSFSKTHSHAPEVPIVVLTGMDMEDESLAIKAVNEGAQDYLVKSDVDKTLLTRSLRYAIERKRA